MPRFKEILGYLVRGIVILIIVLSVLWFLQPKPSNTAQNNQDKNGNQAVTGSVPGLQIVREIVAPDVQFANNNQLFCSTTNVTNQTGGGTTYAAANGITLSQTTFKLGGPLTENTTINGSGKNLTVTSASGAYTVNYGVITLDAATSLALTAPTVDVNGYVKVSSTGSQPLKINGVNYGFPSSQGTNTFLKNDGSGNLTWSSAPSGSGTVTSVHTSSGLTGGIITTSGTISVNSPTCSGTDKLQWTGSAFVCSPDVGGGSVTSVNSGNGLSGGPITSSGSLSINAPTCPGTTKLQWNGSAFVCSADVDTTYTVSNGLSMVGADVRLGGALSANTTVNQGSFNLLLTGTGNIGVGTAAPAAKFAIGTNSEFQVNNAGNLTKINNVSYNWPGSQGGAGQVLTNDGSGNLTWVTNGSGTGTVTNVATGNGLSGGPITSTGTVSINAPTCAGTDKLQWNGTAFVCSPDVSNAGTVTSVATGNGLTGGPITSSGTVAISAPICAGTDKLQWNGTAFTCSADVDTNTTYSASNGLTLTGTNFTLGGTLTGATTINQSTFNLLFNGTGNVGIGAATPSAKLSVGTNSEFQVSSVGDLTRINNISYSWPSSQASAGQVLTNDGSGNLSWTSAGACASCFVNNGNAFGGLATLGTTDANDLRLITNGAERLRIDANSGAIGIGVAPNIGTAYVSVARDTSTLNDFLIGQNTSITASTGADGAYIGGQEIYASTNNSDTISLWGMNGLGSYVDVGTNTSTYATSSGADIYVQHRGFANNDIIGAAINGGSIEGTGTGDIIGVYSVARNTQAFSPTLHNFANVIGVDAHSWTEAENAGISTNNAIGVKASILLSGPSSGSGAHVGNAMGLDVENPTFLNAGNIIDNNYGVYIKNQTQGNNDYGLYIEGSDTAAIWINDGLTRLAAAGTASASLNIPSSAGVDPTLPSSGDLWWTGSALNFRTASSTVDLLTPGACSTCFVNNGNSFGGTATIGTNDNNALAFETNNVTHVSLTTGGDLQGNAVVSNGSTTTTGTGASTTTLTVSSTTNFDAGNLILVNSTYTRIVSVDSGVQLTVSPAVSWSAGQSVVEYVTPSLGSLANIQNRFDTGYFMNGIVTGSASTIYADGLINKTSGSLKINTTNNQNIQFGTGNIGIGTAPAASAAINMSSNLSVSINTINTLPVGQSGYSILANAFTSTSGTTASLEGIHTEARPQTTTTQSTGLTAATSIGGTGAVSDAYGIRGYVLTSNSNAISTATGIESVVNTSNAPTTNTYGFYTAGVGGTAITNNYDVYVGNLNSATVANNYGVYIKDHSITGTSNSYNFYSQGVNSKNYFDGSILSGTNTNTAFINVAGSTSSKASFQIGTGSNPTSPNSGDLWWNGNTLNFFNGSAAIDMLGGTNGYIQLAPVATQTTSSTNSLINLTTTANTVNPLIKVNNNGIGTPDLLDLQSAGNSKFKVDNSGTVTVANNILTSQNTTVVSDATWTQHATAKTGSVMSSRTVADNTGNVYLAGVFSGTVNFGTGNIIANSSSDFFLVKYSSSGSPQWVAHSAANAGFLNSLDGVTVDNSGNVYITGTYYGGTLAVISGNNMPANGGGYADYFVAKFDGSNGNPIWAMHSAASTGGGVGIYVAGIAYDASTGRVYVTGHFGGTVTFYSGGASIAHNGGVTYVDYYIVALNASTGAGAFAVHSAANSEDVVPLGIAIDPGNAIYIAGELGHILGSTTFGTTVINSSGISDSFILKVNMSGTTVWVTHLADTLAPGGSYEGMYGGVKVDSHGDVYTSGYYMSQFAFTKNASGSNTNIMPVNGTRDFFLAKFSGANGSFLWAKHSTANTGNVYALGLTIDSSDNLYIGGIFTGTTDFGTGSIVSNYSSGDPFVAKFSSSGKPLWANHTTANASCSTYSSTEISLMEQYGIITYHDIMNADSTNNLYFSGARVGTASCTSLNFGSGAYAPITNDDYFLVKYTPDAYSGSSIGSVVSPFANVYSGKYNGQELNISNFDLAEEYTVDDSSITAGDVVKFKLSAANKLTVERAGGTSKSYDGESIGVISTDPGLYLKDWQVNNKNGRPVALAGRVPVKVTTENGSIKRGDYLTTSSTPGYAMKATKGGMIIGRAMEDFPTSQTSTGDSSLVKDKLTQDAATGQTIVSTMVLTGQIDTSKMDTAQKAVATITKTNSATEYGKGRIMMYVNLSYINDNFYTGLPDKATIPDDSITQNPIINNPAVTPTPLVAPAVTTTQSAVSLPDLLTATSVNINKGKLTIDSDGNMVLAGMLMAPQAKIQLLFVTTIKSQGNGINVNLGDNESFQVTDSKNNVVLGASTASGVNFGSASGSGKIATGTTEVSIKNAYIKSSSHILITPREYAIIYIKEQSNGSFVAAVKDSAQNDIKFDYLIIN